MIVDVRLSNETWESLFTAHTKLMRGFLSSDAWDVISMREYDVLYTMSKSDHPMRLNELREGSLLSQPALSRLVDRLVDQGLVSRETSVQDRRAIGLVLTEAGREMQRQVGRRHAGDVAQSMSGLTEEEMHTFKALCIKLAG